MRVGIFLAVLVLMAATVRAGEVGDSREVERQRDQVQWRFLVREWLGSSQELKVREQALVLASREFQTVAQKIKIVPASPEIDQLLIDSATRHAEAMVAVEQARRALANAETELWKFYLEHAGKRVKEELGEERKVWNVGTLILMEGSLEMLLPPIPWVENVALQRP